MILIVTHSSDVTADFMCERLRAEDRTFIRIDSDRAPEVAELAMIGDGLKLRIDELTVTPEDVGCIWLRRPKAIAVTADDPAEGAHTSAEWGEAFEGFFAHVQRSHWINHPSANAVASHKLEQLTRARTVGLRIPDTLLTQDAATARSFFERHHGKIIAKPLSTGYIERDSVERDTHLYTSRVTASDLDNAELLRRCPTLFQAELRKACDVRLCWVDDRITAVRLVRRPDDQAQILDIRRDNMNGVEHSRLEVPSEVAEALQRLVRSYGLRFAAVDFAIDHDGAWTFFEVNPNGQWAWLDQVGVSDVAGDLLWAMTK